MCPRQESNLHCKIRNLASYPLNDEGLLRWAQELNLQSFPPQGNALSIKLWGPVAEGVRFELTRAFLPAGFQDRFLANSEHPSLIFLKFTTKLTKNQID